MSTNYRNEDEVLSLAELIRKAAEIKAFLLSRKYTIFLSSLLFAGLFYGASYLLKPSYKARITFILEEGDKMGGVLGNYLNLASQFGFGGAAQGGFSADNVIELLKSTAIVKEALYRDIETPDGKKELLINYYIDIHELRDKWNEDPRLKNITFSRTIPETGGAMQRDSILNGISEKVLSDIQISKASRQSNMLIIEYPSKDQLFSKTLVENLLLSLTKFYTEKKTLKAKDVLQFIQHRADSVKRELDRAEIMLARTRDASRGIIKAEGYLNEGRLMRDVQILNIMYGEIVKNLEMSKFTLLNQTPLFQVIDKPILPLKRNVVLSRKAAIALGFLLGFFVSSLYLLIREKFRKSLSEGRSVAG
jgi:LPS O-antigen subunit length determinant protein (WzzB/FepE family)